MPGILEQRLTEQAAKEKKETRKTAPERTSKKTSEKRSRGDEKPEKSSPKQKSQKDFMKGRPETEEPIGHYDDSPLTDEDILELEQLEAMASHEEYIKTEKRRKTSKRITTIILTAACVYLTMLIYGTIVTEFKYNEIGEVAPVELSVEDISNRNEYTTVMGFYLQCRALYERVLILDYRMGAGVEDLMSIAPEYEEAIDTASALAVQIDASTVGSKYNQLISMLYTWAGTHMYNYCGYISTAVAQNDANAEAEAIAARQVVMDNFQLITQNMITMGADIKGYDLTDIKEWSPEGYVQEHI